MDNWQLDRLGEGSGDEEEEEVVGASRDYPVAGMVFLIDAAQDMFDQPVQEEEGQEEDPPFKRAIIAAHATLTRKAIVNRYDMQGVVLFNTKKAKNQLEFPGVFVLQELQRPSADNIFALEDVMGLSQSEFESTYGHSDTASIHDALRTCQNLFHTSTLRHMRKSVLLFTCRDDPHARDPQRRRQAMAKARDLRESAVSLEVIHMGAAFDVAKFYKELITLDNPDDDEMGETSRETSLSNPNTRLEELTERVRRLENKQRVSARVTLTLAPGVSLGVGVYSLVRRTTKPRKEKLWKNTNQEVKAISRTFLTDTGELMSRSDYEYYHKYGNRKISFTMDEAQNIGNIYESGMELLGFKPMSWLKTLHYYKEAKFIYPKEDVLKGSTRVFAALLERCVARGVVAVVRLVVRQRTAVSLAALIPQEEVLNEAKVQVLPQGFLVHHLPFADNFSTTEIKGRVRAKERQVDIAKKVIKKLSFTYKPDNFDNPDTETMWEIIKALALNRSHLEPVTDHTVPKTDEMEKRAGAQLREFERVVFSSSLSSSAKTISATSALLASKRVKVKIDNDNLDVETMVRRGQAQQLTVPVLKSWLTARGMSITGKKKAELMQAVIDAVCA